MYPVPPESHRPTNYYWILIAGIIVMLALALGLLRNLSGKLTSSTPAAVSSPRGAPAAIQPRPVATALAIEATPVPAVTPTPSTVQVTPKELAAAPAAYRSRSIKVEGKVFYLGTTDGGKQWIQIVSDDKVYVDASYAGTLPVGISKGSDVIITGIGAGLTPITAIDGKEYDQPYIDPAEKIELVGASPVASQ